MTELAAVAATYYFGAILPVKIMSTKSASFATDRLGVIQGV